MKSRTFELLDARAGQRILEIGCGTGDDFVVGDASKLDLESATFDACRIERTLIHIPEPPVAVSEMARALRSGGKLVAYEPDLEAYVVDSSYRELSRWLLKFWYGQLQCGWISRHLPVLFKESGLADINVEPRAIIYDFDPAGPSLYGTMQCAVEAGVATADEVAAWFADLEQARDNGTFFCANMGYIVSGRKL